MSVRDTVIYDHNTDRYDHNTVKYVRKNLDLDTDKYDRKSPYFAFSLRTNMTVSPCLHIEFESADRLTSGV